MHANVPDTGIVWCS